MILENKFGLTNFADLTREEERISKKRAAELFDNKLLDSFPAGKFATLPIHFVKATAEALAFGSTIS